MAVIAYGKYTTFVFGECQTDDTVSIDIGEEQYSLVENDGYYLIDGQCYQKFPAQSRQQTGNYPIHTIAGPFEDCGCAPKQEPTIKKRVGNIEYYEKINCEFADAVYNKAMAERYGVEFCCEKDLQRLTIKKKLLDAGALQDDVDLCLL